MNIWPVAKSMLT